MNSENLNAPLLPTQTPRALEPLKNVHEILGDASAGAHPMPEVHEVASFKLDPEVKALAHSICSRHATDLSSFLRGCTTQLVKDYLP